MDILYYSNHCKHSKKVLDFLVKGGIVSKLSCICIDKRGRDPKTGQLIISLEDGAQIKLPPNIRSVPSLLLVNDKYKLVLGNDIIKHFEPQIQEKIKDANFGNGEPLGFPINRVSGSGGSNIVSEQFTYFNQSPEELSAKGNGGQRQMYNYVPVEESNMAIVTPPDTYRPDKVSDNVTVDKLMETRNLDIPNQQQMPQFEYKQMNTGY